MAEILSQAQIDEYNDVGAIVVRDILSPEEVAGLRRVTDQFVERSREHTAHTDIFDLEDTHTPAQPRVRRIKQPHLHDPVYGVLVRILGCSRCCAICGVQTSGSTRRS